MLLILWLLGFSLHSAGGLIHLLLPATRVHKRLFRHHPPHEHGGIDSHSCDCAIAGNNWLSNQSAYVPSEHYCSDLLNPDLLTSVSTLYAGISNPHFARLSAWHDAGYAAQRYRNEVL
ncbi:MAG: DUF5670 family protein [Terriglobales bacterium]